MQGEQSEICFQESKWETTWACNRVTLVKMERAVGMKDVRALPFAGVFCMVG